MNKEEFQTKKNDIDSKIRELKNQKIKLEKEYIESNAKYPIGSKVCITTPASTYIRLDNHESVVIPKKKQYAYIKGNRHFEMIRHCKKCPAPMPKEIHPLCKAMDGKTYHASVSNMLPIDIHGEFIINERIIKEE